MGTSVHTHWGIALIAVLDADPRYFLCSARHTKAVDVRSQQLPVDALVDDSPDEACGVRASNATRHEDVHRISDVHLDRANHRAQSIVVQHGVFVIRYSIRLLPEIVLRLGVVPLRHPKAVNHGIDVVAGLVVEPLHVDFVCTNEATARQDVCLHELDDISTDGARLRARCALQTEDLFQRLLVRKEATEDALDEA